MMRVLQIAAVFIFVATVTTESLACVCVADPLGTRYRKAKAVFIGRALDQNEKQPAPALVQGDLVQTIEVIKSWKGIHKKYVAVSFERVTNTGDCPVLYYLEPGKQYLVFAYGKEFEVRTVCSD